MIKQFHFKQFNVAYVICLHSVELSNSSIWPIDRILSGTTPRESRPENDGNERVLRIPQRFSITGASQPDRFVSYIGHILLYRDAVGVFYSQLDWMKCKRIFFDNFWYTHIHIHIYIYTHTHIYTHIHIHIYTHTHTHIYIYIYKYLYI